MVSRSRQEWRRHCYGGYRNSGGTRTRGHFLREEKIPKYEETYWCDVVCRIPWRLPRRRLGPLANVRTQDSFVLTRFASMSGERDHVRACTGAEKSCRGRRRKRGLRKGRRRSRVVSPSQIRPRPATSSKPQRDRHINHVGRKFIWAVKTSNRFRKVCLKYLNTPHHLRGKGYRKSLEVWWQRLADRARLMDIPYQASFHSTFWDYMRIEVHSDPGHGFDMLLAGLPRRDEIHEQGSASSSGTRPATTNNMTTSSIGNSTWQGPKPAFSCKKCRDLGATPGPGYPYGCSACYSGHHSAKNRWTGGKASIKRRQGRSRRP
jgi:hypothetical protein